MTTPPRNPPVTDWATDFDHTDPAWASDPYPIWADLASGAPSPTPTATAGRWLPTRYEDIAAVAYDTEHFSSQAVLMTNARPQMPPPVGPAPPITSDPPYHQQARRLLLPAFAPEAHRGVGAVDPGAVPGPARRARRPRRGRWRRRLRPARPGRRDRPHARPAARGRRPASAASSAT